MTLTLERISSYVESVVGGKPAAFSISDLCDQAGDTLVSMHNWQWLIRPSAAVTITGSYFKLPRDFGRFIEMHDESGSALVDFVIVPFEILAQQRTDIASDNTRFFGSIVYARSVVDGRLEPRMEVWPTPDASVTAFKMTYRSKWVSPDVGEVFAIPSWIEPLYLRLVLAFAQGYDEADIGSVDARIAEIATGPLFRFARENDGSVRPNVIGIRGGAMRSILGDSERVAVGIATRTMGPTQP